MDHHLIIKHAKSYLIATLEMKHFKFWLKKVKGYKKVTEDFKEQKFLHFTKKFWIFKDIYIFMLNIIKYCVLIKQVY